MVYPQEELKGEIKKIFESLELTRRFTGSPSEFWPTFLEESARLLKAKSGSLMVQVNGESSWKNICVWPVGGHSKFRATDLRDKMKEVAETSVQDGYAFKDARSLAETKVDGMMVGIRLDLEDDERTGVAVYHVDNVPEINVEKMLTCLKFVANIPAAYQIRRVARQAKMDVVQFAEALDLMILLNTEKKYLAAVMTFCNELASRYSCERVSLGWLKGVYIRLQAISHMEKFEKKMEAVQLLEAAMEEAIDQDEEILFPRPAKSNFVVKDHETFSKEQGSNYIVSLPIRLDDDPMGVVTCERSNKPFSEEDVRGLRILCDQAARRLGDLKRHDRWFGARIVTSVKDSLGNFFSVKHTFAKLMSIVICGALAFLIFGKLNYRVKANFILKTDDLAYLPAPFDGYIHEVHVNVGDLIKKKDPILSLDTRELLIEESTAIANQNRYAREAEKSRAQNALADMKIALALEAQAKARLKLVRYHIGNAHIKAPFKGIVVEGDLEELLGTPVRKGDILFKVARIEKIYAELKVDERDIHEISAGATGEISFVSRPDLEFPIRLERINPVALTEEDGNVFLTRAGFPEKVAKWWRPGMSGVAKINVGKRNILWIFTHRTIDFFRLLFWW
jgi:biotin carboxyl carrier protein